jgi:amidohydrolase
MGAEDFAYFAQQVPGLYFLLGVGNKAKGITAMIHTPAFDVDEESLIVGTKVAATLLLDYLGRRAQ